MSRIAKWKLEKTKVKVVFRLQFHATHIPQTGWDKLFVSFIPADSGKVTGKTSKANVRNGTCKWADPIYETTRLLQDTKTRLYDEKLYKLVVAMGSSRSSLLGEATFNLADYADASKPSAISLPLNGSNSGTVLHVTVQPLTSKTGFREFEQQRELRETGMQTSNQNRNDGLAENLSAPADKVNARVRFKSESRELPSLEEVVELNEDSADSVIGNDVSSNTSESLYAEKHDSSTHEIDSLKSTMSGDLGGLSLSQSPHLDKGDPSDHRLLAQGANDWVQGWSSDYSMDNDLANAYEENSRLRGSLDVAESSILQLKLELSSLQSHADELGAKTQEFGEVLDAEIASGEELSKEVSVLKSECSKFKDGFEQLKHSRLSPHSTSTELLSKDQVQLFYDLQMRWIQGLLVMEDKVREVEDKACHEYQESDLRFLHPDLESLKTVLQDLREGTTEVVLLLNVKPAELVDVKEIGATHVQEPEQFVSVGELGDIEADHSQYEGILHHLRRPVQVFQVPDPVDATIALESKIGELSRELEESKIDRDNLTRKLDQMECYYEALIQELEESQKQMLGELQNLRNEHSTCLYTISSCKTQMETMHQDMNKQFLRFTEDKRDLESLNKELETRAMNSETALKKARWNYSVAVGQLQKDLELLSFQVLSMFETNENLIRQAFTEPSQHCLQECLEENAEAVDSCLHKDEVDTPTKTEQVLASDKVVSLQVVEEKKDMTINEDLGVKTPRDLNALDSSIVPVAELPSTDTKCKDSRKAEVAEVMEYQIHNSELKRQLLSGEILFENLKRSLQSQEELYQNTEDELCKTHMVNVHLDVFSKVLQETMREANNGIKIMKQEMNGLAEKLAHSTLSEELLMLRLQAALDDVNIQRENNAISITKCNELALQNEILEDKLQGIFAENCLLQKVSEYEVLLMECRSFESKYEVCTSEKTELMYLLKQESLEKFSLKNEVSSMQEELEMLKADLDSESSLKDNLERTVSLLQDRLWDLRSTMASYDQQINGPLVNHEPVKEELESKNFLSIFLHLEQLQNKAYGKILELIQEKKDVEEQRDIAQRSLSSMESDNLLVKQKYESEIQDMVNKLDMSMDNVEKLQLEIENISIKLKNSLEAEEKYAEHIREMFTKLEVFEVNMQHVTSENADLAQKILVLEKVNEELEKTKLTIVDSTRENQAMMISLQAGNEESVKLENELSNVKENLYCLSSELQKERSLRIGLEGTVSDLSSQLNLRNDQLLSLDTVTAELVQLKKLVSDLELELSNVRENLNSVADELQTERSLKIELEGTVSDLSSQLNLKNDQLLSFDTVSSGLFQLKKLVSDLELELSNAKESLNCMSDELQTERSFRIQSEGRVSDLSSQLNLKNNQLISFDTLNAELVQLKKLVSDLELEKSRVCHRLLHSEESGRKAEEDNSSLRLQVTILETHLVALHECFLAADVELIYTRNQFQTREQQLVQQLESLDRSYRELHLKHLDVLKTTNDRMSNEAQYAEENSRLLTTLNTLRSDLDSAFIEKKSLLDRSNSISFELEKHKTRAAVAEISDIQDKHQYELEIEHLKHMLLSSEEVIDNLTSSQDQLEITVIVLQTKLNEKHMQLLLLEEYANELMMLRNQQKDLTQKLSEQILKTEEFKNLSIHLKELKDKADAENLQAREKRDTEGPSIAQESLRMVFIKEQCETKLQEMRTQLYVSKKHGEEMLLKLQDALNEVENRKKTEASHLKRNEELSLKISELETELQAALADKREKVRAYDRMKAELECSMLSLDCCKEEKQKLEASLRECNEDRTKITGELSSLKDRLESLASTRNIQDIGSFKPYVVDPKSSESVNEEISSDVEDASRVSSQDSITSKSVLNMPRQTVVDQENLLQNNKRHLALIKEHVNTQSLMSSMDQLHKELERMKNENLASLTPRDEQDFQQVFPGLQRELLQLHKANEQLGSIFPLFNDFSSGGNAMERVLALEMELAEALQAKRKPTVHFQSSFLKQHSNEVAIFQSFRDINELIQDMLELKGRYGTVETELKEMHDRYSQLSLQFAEVEGERQKLVMTLKNNRVPKKAAYLYRSPSDSLGDHS